MLFPESSTKLTIADAGSKASAASSRATGGDWVTLLRPRQWIKNLVVFAGLLFTAKFRYPGLVLTVLGVFAVFCLLSSVGYIVNDVLDRARDRAHPVKCHRPIASGRISWQLAVLCAVLLLMGALGFCYWLTKWPATLVGAAYLVLTLSYSYIWKHRVILDIVAIAGCFLLRALAGTVCLGVSLSPWLFVCLSFLALLLGFGKRRNELQLLQDGAENHRPVLARYSLAFADQMIMVMTASTIMTYAIYAIQSPTARMHPALVYTVPLVLYATMRYIYLIQHFNRGGQPEEIFLTDRPMIITLLLWGALISVIFIYY
jgi:4-hydroxybenzoate polyprenyltransferase